MVGIREGSERKALSNDPYKISIGFYVKGTKETSTSSPSSSPHPSSGDKDTNATPYSVCLRSLMCDSISVHFPADSKPVHVILVATEPENRPTGYRGLFHKASDKVFSSPSTRRPETPLCIPNTINHYLVDHTSSHNTLTHTPTNNTRLSKTLAA